MAPSEREDVISALASKIFSAMLDDILMDVALQSKHEVGRSNAICKVCSTRCGLVHTPGTANSPNHASMSRPATPASADTKGLNGSAAGTGTNTPTSVKGEGTLLECVNCSRQIASNRYAPHLSACMGLASARRGGIRGNPKTKQPSEESGRSVSPESEAGLVSDESRNLKGKGKSKVKRADEAEFNLKRKRLSSPQISPNKKPKKPKGTGPPTSRIKAEQDSLSSTYSGSQSKIPSRLRESSTASLMERSPTPSSRSSSPEVVSAGTPTSSSFSGQSPTLTSKSIGIEKTLKNKALGIGPPKRLSPPKPPPIHVQTYAIDVEGGDETGSSTDTDSS